MVGDQPLLSSSQHGLEISPVPPYSSPPTNFPAVQHTESVSLINTKETLLVSLDFNQSSAINSNDTSIPTSRSDLENELKYRNTSLRNDTSVYQSCGSSTEHNKRNGYATMSNVRINDHASNNNTNIEYGSMNSVSTTATLNVRSNNICNNVSSQNTSKTNCFVKTQKSFKNQSPKTMIIDGNSNAKDHNVETENVREIGRFSPTPTPYVDFPLQFNFGSTYASSVTVFFDN